MNLQENIASLKKKLESQGVHFDDLSASSLEPELDSGHPASPEKYTDQTDAEQSLSEAAIRQLLQDRKMRELGKLTASMIHEINTPLQYIWSNLEFLEQSFEELSKTVALTMNLIEEEGIEDPTLQQCEKNLDFVLSRLPKAIQQSMEGVDNLDRIVRATRRFSHTSEMPEEANLNECLDSAVTISRGEWKYIAKVKFEPDPELPTLTCLPGELIQGFLNMIVNAAQAIRDKLGEQPETLGQIEIKTSHDQEQLHIDIADTGAGIPSEMAKQIFTPFFTTRELGKGTGQGLAICHTIFVDKHQGKIGLQSLPGEGTNFRISLPRKSGTAECGSSA